MQQVETISALRTLRKDWRQQQQIVGFVPTMGNLHEGHLQLVRAAKARCDRIVVSIFVNPMQFGANEDLDAYPRTLDADKEKLAALGVDVVFVPSVAEMYPRGLAQQTYVEVPEISDVVCGASRPGHFRGVATIVCKLFNMVAPDVAFFGEKDYQQLQVIKAMVADLSMDLTIVGVPTEREKDGLAMSSRNGYLSAEQRQKAATIYATLTELKAAIECGDHHYAGLCAHAAEELNNQGFKTDYVEIRQGSTLAIAGPGDRELVILIAAYLGTTRLIDNMQISL